MSKIVIRRSIMSKIIKKLSNPKILITANAIIILLNMTIMGMIGVQPLQLICFGAAVVGIICGIIGLPDPKDKK